jgi:hypothetical protein
MSSSCSDPAAASTNTLRSKVISAVTSALELHRATEQVSETFSDDAVQVVAEDTARMLGTLCVNPYVRQFVENDFLVVSAQNTDAEHIVVRVNSSYVSDGRLHEMSWLSPAFKYNGTQDYGPAVDTFFPTHLEPDDVLDTEIQPELIQNMVDEFRLQSQQYQKTQSIKANRQDITRMTLRLFVAPDGQTTGSTEAWNADRNHTTWASKPFTVQHETPGEVVATIIRESLHFITRP